MFGCLAFFLLLSLVLDGLLLVTSSLAESWIDMKEAEHANLCFMYNIVLVLNLCNFLLFLLSFLS